MRDTGTMTKATISGSNTSVSAEGIGATQSKENHYDDGTATATAAATATAFVATTAATNDNDNKPCNSKGNHAEIAGQKRWEQKPHFLFLHRFS